jgi:hypothetical protein
MSGIVALQQERCIQALRERIGEAVAELEPDRMLAPLAVSEKA